LEEVTGTRLYRLPKVICKKVMLEIPKKKQISKNKLASRRAGKIQISKILSLLRKV
jgi:hypothetical protein